MAVDPEGNVWWNPATWNWKRIGKVIGGAILTVVGVGVTLFGLSQSAIPVAGGTVTHLGTAMAAYGVITIASEWDPQIQQDMDDIGWNPFNLNANLAVQSEKVSFYRGMPVIRHSSTQLTSWQIGGIIFFNKNTYDPINSLKHESGHGIQEAILGTPKYLIHIAIPSVIMCGLSFVNQDVNDFYYNFPWERTADWFGGVTRTTGNDRHRKGSLELSIIYFILSLLF